MDSKPGKNSKQIILEAAKELFAEKGFDGARVDEIAKRARVNKALIYYYFESKEKILGELMLGLVKELKEFKDQLIVVPEDSDLKQFFNEERKDALIFNYFKFFEKHKLLLQIIMAESLKGDGSKGVLFEMLSFAWEDTMCRIEQMTGGAVSEFEELSTAAVFFALLPMLNFVAFGEKWAKYNGLDFSAVEAGYYRIFKKIYHDYFVNTVLLEE
ncbi:TetR/AcrR family transcriptional regulator [Desulfoscipio sp. XC116]|uniref:TetR/AcrR family transcriptional regulator n=1 Tax=Desulfoscipio sp. XC116 TaxID=3144975 RepID=UPI00325B41A5